MSRDTGGRRFSATSDRPEVAHPVLLLALPPTDRVRLTRALTAAGFSVYDAPTPAEARRLSAAVPFGLVVSRATNIRLPE